MASASSTTNELSRKSHPVAPVVSVVMPTYNGERFLRPAIDSILNQTFPDFELIVIDDGSTDNTRRILADLKEKDARLVVLTNERNLGIAGATNKGFDLARGQYVALQDHDDISLPHRFQTQVDFLNSHPDMALVSSAATLIDENGSTQGDFPQPCEEIDLKWELLWSCPIHHTAVMMRRSAIIDVGGYPNDPALRFAEAWEPLAHIATRYRIANLPDRLVLWRRHSAAASIKHRQQALAACEATVLRNIDRLSKPHGTDAAFDLEFRYSGLRAYLYTPGIKPPQLPAQQVIAGLQLLCEVQERFYQINHFPRRLAARHRRPLNWSWGKHAVGLAMRAPWTWRSRVRILMMGVRLLSVWAWAVIIG
jgi:glycosyltransferase involved in cell wall biosynthesis